MKRNLIIITLSIALLGVSLLAIRPLLRKKADPGLIALQEVKRIEELHLVSYRYEDMFFYHSRQDKGKRVVVITTVPVLINAYFDMSKAEITVKDSSLLISLPKVSLSEPNYLIDRMRVQNVRRFSIMIGVDLHRKLLEGLSERIAARKPMMIEAARHNGIAELAATQAERYFEAIFKPLGYSDVTITLGEETRTNADSLPEPALIPIDGITPQ
jgi:hypothetical protein